MKTTRPLLALMVALGLAIPACAPPASAPSESTEETAPTVVETPEAGETEEAPAQQPAETEPAAAEPESSEPEASTEASTEAPAAEQAASESQPEPVQLAQADSATAQAKPEAAPTAVADGKQEGPFGGGKDWTQWGGTSLRNNVAEGTNIPTEWDPGSFDRETGEWDKESSQNIKWVAKLGSQSYGNPVVADGKVFVGTNNGAGYIERYPADVDLGCLIAFDEKTGEFLWQHSSPKLPSGRVHDWPLQGICSAVLVEGKRLWFVTSRGEVKCLDTEGFRDGENAGPYTEEEHTGENEADIIWQLDMMRELGISQHNMANCSVTTAGDLLFVCTSNGVDESHINLPAVEAPSFICLDKNTGKLLWSDKSPGENILHGQWSSPTYAVLGGVPQVIFAGGDSWLYSFHGQSFKDGKPELLWKFDGNPKESKYILGGAGTRNEIIATPVVYKGLVYFGVGQDPEHGEGIGHLWCIDPTKRGDISAELAFKLPDVENPIPHRRLQAVIAEEGEVARPNPNSGVVWHYSEYDLDGDGEVAFEETMHRTCGTVAIKDDLLFVADFSGLFHCIDAKTGIPYWTEDLLAATWGSPLIVEDKVYIGDEDGDVTIFRVSKEKEIVGEVNMGNAVYSTPVVANGTLYIANKTHLFAIENLEEE